MTENEALWAHILALIAMQMRLITSVVAMAPTPEEARKTLFQHEQATQKMVPDLLGMIPGGPGANDRIRAKAHTLISDWFAGFRFDKKPGPPRG